MKIALVYDHINKIGGAERVLEALGEIWPEAPLYTSVYYSQGASWSLKFKVVSSFLNRFPLAKKNHELYPGLMPLAFESFDFNNFDLVISITSAEAKGIITKPETKHLCYCLTPTRYLWSSYEEYFRNKFLKFLTKPLINYLRNWDQVAAQRPDFYLAISQNVQKRIKKYYNRSSEVIYPPVDTDKWKINKSLEKEDNKDNRDKIYNKDFLKDNSYFLVVSRLVAYKKIDLVIEAFNYLKLPLKIIGTGSQKKRLQAMAGPNIEFLGQLTDQELLSYYQNCRALIFPQDEDFGLVPLEVQACGKPVIALRAGGALETVIEGKTGLFFESPNKESLIKAIKKFKINNYQAKDCRQNAEKFSKIIFKKNFKNWVEKNLK